MTEPTPPEPDPVHSAPEQAVSTDVVRRRAVPTFYAVDADLRIHFACGVPRTAGMERLPSRVERIVRNLISDGRTGATSAIGVDGDTIVRIVEPYSRTADLMCIIVEKLRMRDPLHEAIERFGITTRETQVLRLLLQGASTATIAKALSIAETTACDHVRRIATKTASRGRGQIVAKVLGFL
jgi:DNA-binding CsgD family transcriptional regulator